jgi:5-methylcytosine-specific restriction endonuclease McrA
MSKQFKEGMTWENRREWHIDHIIPVSSFDLSDAEQAKKAFHWSNCQPLWAKENLLKGSKLTGDAA